MGKEIDSINADIEQMMQDALDEREELENDDDNSDDNNSDDNSDSDENENTEEEENDSNDNEEKEHKEENDTDENDSGEQHSESSKDFTPIKTKVNGQEITLESHEEIERFINNQNRSTQQDESINDTIVSQAGLSQEDLVLLADIKAGNIGALNKLAKDNKMDLADVDEFEGEYKSEFKPKIKSDIEKVADQISTDKDLASKFSDVVSGIQGQAGDDFLAAIGSNAQDLASFASHVKDGIAQELLPQAVKEMAVNGGTLLENYIKLGEAKFKKSSESTKVEKKQERTISKREQSLRDRASSDADENKGGKSSDLSVDDLWEDSILEKVKNGEINLRDLD